MEKKNSQQLSLMAFGDMDAATANVFGTKQKKDESGLVLHESSSLLKNKDIAVALGLDVKDDKDAIAEAILKGKDALKRKMALMLVKAQSDEFWTGGGVKVVYSKAGKTGKLSKAKVIFSLEEARRPQGPDDEAIAKALHIPVEEVQKMRQRQEKALANQNVDVESSAPEKPVEKTEDEIIAELEAEANQEAAGVTAGA